MSMCLPRTLTPTSRLQAIRSGRERKRAPRAPRRAILVAVCSVGARVIVILLYDLYGPSLLFALLAFECYNHRRGGDNVRAHAPDDARTTHNRRVSKGASGRAAVAAAVSPRVEANREL